MNEIIQKSYLLHNLNTRYLEAKTYRNGHFISFLVRRYEFFKSSF